MGVRVVEADSASDSYDEDDCASCCAGKAKNESSNNCFQFASKDLVGNCKEFRIENNNRNLRIIGNGNRIRISNNSGSLTIIGNDTRLKIQRNSANIKYTGNNGRIYLGRDSPQQSVDYIGCNGILKVVKSLDLTGQSAKCPKTKRRSQNGGAATSGEAPPLPNHGLGIEISSNVTIVNSVGNIVIKNAVNVSI